MLEKAKPEKLPKLTYAPFLLALSVVVIAWGLISFWIIAAFGGVGFFIALAIWIRELLDENINENE